MNGTIRWMIGGLLVATLGAPQSSWAAQEDPKAPDGKPGLGSERSANELGRLFVSPDDQAEALLRELHELPSDILIQREGVRRAYRTAGYFDLLGRGHELELSTLHEEYQRQNLDAMGALMGSDRSSGPFMEMFLDSRFQVRMGHLDRFEFEARELRKGMRVVHASQEGFFDLRDSEAKNISSRIDLSAAILRSIQLDLDALRDRGDQRAPGAADPAWMAELIGLTKLKDESERVRAFEALEEKVDRRRGQLETSLFLPRLMKKVALQVDKRDAYAAQALQHLERTKQYLLLPPFDEDPPRQIKDMSINERHRFALSDSVRGLAADPLNEELTYLTGIATEMIYSPRESRMWFDRYLALRGIRAQDSKTTRNRELTKEESYALERVMQAFTGPGGPFGR